MPSHDSDLTHRSNGLQRVLDVQGPQAGNIKDKNGALMRGEHLRTGSHGQIMIAVDSGYPADMPHSYDDDGRFSPDKYAAHNGMLNGVHSGKVSRDISSYSARHGGGGLNGHGGHGGHHEQPPVVDLALPTVYSQMRTDSGTAYTVTAPRQGQDIFDTWCAFIYATGHERSWVCAEAGCDGHGTACAGGASAAGACLQRTAGRC